VRHASQEGGCRGVYSRHRHEGRRQRCENLCHPEGFADAGIDIPYGEGIVPEDDRLNGEHIASYYESLDDDARKARFSKYIKEGVDVTSLPDMVARVKDEIMKKGE
jgi:hypothetical protein